MKIELKHMNPSPGASSEEYAKVVLARFGLIPRKSDAKAGFHNLLLEFYERKKYSLKEKKPQLAIIQIEEMADLAGIKRQTMYDYLNRWVMLQIIKKASFASSEGVFRGYELNGQNLENAFRKAETVVHGHLSNSIEMIKELQNEIKKDKLRSQQSSL